jgi:hypothetical protein
VAAAAETAQADPLIKSSTLCPNVLFYFVQVIEHFSDWKDTKISIFGYINWILLGHKDNQKNKFIILITSAKKKETADARLQKVVEMLINKEKIK